jgi:hypothetical protein
MNFMIALRNLKNGKITSGQVDPKEIAEVVTQWLPFLCWSLDIQLLLIVKAKEMI